MKLITDNPALSLRSWDHPHSETAVTAMLFRRLDAVDITVPNLAKDGYTEVTMTIALAREFHATLGRVLANFDAATSGPEPASGRLTYCD